MNHGAGAIRLDSPRCQLYCCRQYAAKARISSLFRKQLTRILLLGFCSDMYGRVESVFLGPYSGEEC